ncbi:MBL fold metallo-hydrolase [Rheinheimera mangrovi]|uniref:MBL fold metallo-hydrolase n=1 Tax=Rheinheimera mangrovi TaxID=2498451 RepID=UPI000F8D54C7|nr:MBL fold metallo-hydrolase [Rheinheimera mangrovi]
MIQASPNYAQGAFKNQAETPFLTNGATQLSIRIENWLVEKKITRPEHLIPAEKTDLFALNPKDDLAIWLGHSSWYLQLGGKRMLIDPVFSNYAAPVPSMIKAFDGTSLYSAEDIPTLDLLLITHDHYDHLDYDTILAIKPLVK